MTFLFPMGWFWVFLGVIFQWGDFQRGFDPPFQTKEGCVPHHFSKELKEMQGVVLFVELGGSAMFVSKFQRICVRLKGEFSEWLWKHQTIGIKRYFSKHFMCKSSGCYENPLCQTPEISWIDFKGNFFLAKKDKAMSKFGVFAVVLLKLWFFQGHYERGSSINQTIEVCQGDLNLNQRRRCHDWSSTRTTSELLPDLLLGSRRIFLRGRKLVHTSWLLCWDIFYKPLYTMGILMKQPIFHRLQTCWSPS